MCPDKCIINFPSYKSPYIVFLRSTLYLSSCRLYNLWWWLPPQEVRMQSQPQHVYPNSWALSYPQHCHWQITLQGTCWCLVSSKLWPTLVRWPQKGETKLQNEGQLWMNTSVCFCCGVRLLHTILYSGWHGNMRADLFMALPLCKDYTTHEQATLSLLYTISLWCS